VTGSHRHTAIGLDLDGFIKPTLAGLADMRDMARLERALREGYGDADAELICSGNALRVLSSWRGNQ
jgi:microsomal dipeptidase-like Zn-dependent dipeptidase